MILAVNVPQAGRFVIRRNPSRRAAESEQSPPPDVYPSIRRRGYPSLRALIEQPGGIP
jgi:hypothetical protein